MQRVHLVSLGCSKNRVDSEVMVGKLLARDFLLVDEPDQADVIIVNTCSFIQPATEESIETVLEMAKFKEAGSCSRLVVTGCMVQRYGASLVDELPEVDHFLGTGDYHRIDDVLAARAGEAPKSFIDAPLYIHDEMAPRVNSWARHSAYLKISEGCNHRCTFCIIPQLRGKLRSRTIESLATEGLRLVSQGVRELNIISQDSTAYGRDLYGQPKLAELLRALARIDGLDWLRLHYAYPIGLPDDLLETIAQEPKVLPYLDMPLQHASGDMLRAMKRGVTREGQERILERLRKAVPDIAIRSTFIVGFPGETEADFEELMDFVRVQRFTRLGVFTYYQEDGTPAAELPNQVDDEVKLDRQKRLMALQSDISLKMHKKLVGQVLPVMLDGKSKESELLLVGRLPSQAPDVDGQVYISSAPVGVRAGQILPCRITQASAYDLVGEIVEA
ncbi:MAG: 30S ribosomal protein S12 methylthiotransferase RimO [Deltaproteobacteria bacterium]|nr:30S ribosomal protein S12 methylthiotransferase RimO [Deltaproteobacteria bacterium]MBK9365468.1 30S ribosomal protein S12 methylthiotransferase RimO [Deltaproteobacteria bacterium]MBK9646386.1 30S ribosomal protein S12 methylthiotransferase RimO [Deltaproteobacteria bacterium]